MYNGAIIKKIPGKLCTGKREKEGFIDDLNKKTKPQLLELLERQMKLTANKSFINKLPDKGEKIMQLKNEIEKELKKRDENEKLSELMERLNMNGKEALDALEWTGNCAPGYTRKTENKETNIDSDDDDTDPLKILVSHSGAGFHKKQHRVLIPEAPLIKPSDLADTDALHQNGSSSTSQDVVEDEYARILCRRVDSTGKTKERFLPHRTLNKSTAKDEKEKKQSRFWEVTAATPPPPVHGDTKLVSLQESIQLQFEQQQKLMEIQMKHATERLISTKHLKTGRVPQSTTGYREPAASSSSEDEVSEHEQEHEEEDYHGGGSIVVYNVVD